MECLFCLMVEKRLTFKKNERLKLRDEIQAVFQSPHKIHEKPFTVIFKEVDSTPELKVMISAPKRKFKKAVDRNLIKRRFREAYRLQKSELQSLIERRDKGLHIVFVYNNHKILPYKEFFEGVGQILLRLRDKYETSA